MKLIKTKLLLKHNHDSAVGIATASHIDFCKYQFRCLRPECSYNEYMNIVVMFMSEVDHDKYPDVMQKYNTQMSCRNTDLKR